MPDNRFSSDPANKNVYQKLSDVNDNACQTCGASISETSTAIPEENSPDGCFQLRHHTPSMILGDQSDYPDKRFADFCMQRSTWDTAEEEASDDDTVLSMESPIARSNSDYVHCPLNEMTHAKAQPDPSYLQEITAVSSQYASQELFEVRIVTSKNYCLSCRRPECRDPDKCGVLAQPKKNTQPVSIYHAWEVPEVQQTSTVTITRVESIYADASLAEQRIIDQPHHAYQLRARDQQQHQQPGHRHHHHN